MAKLPEETVTTVFNLQRGLLELIDEATATDTAIFEYFGETEVTFTVLEQLQNAKQRLTDPYSRLCTLLLRIAELQPIAPAATLDLLAQTIEQGQAAVDASQASIQEAKRDLDIP